MRKSIRIFSIILLAIFFSGSITVFTIDMAAAGQDVIVFAAASTTNAVTEIAILYESKGLGRVKTSFASSSTLAKQIQNGAPADIYISANEKWMDFLVRKDAVKEESRFNLLSNRLVLIAPLKSPVKTIEVKKGLNITPYLGNDGRLSMGDPEHVPAGMYGKKALETLGLWSQVKDCLAPMKDVRAALVLVERSETPLGLVYATDAAISKKVRIVGTFPEDCHPVIVYPAAIVSGGNDEAGSAFLEYIKTPEARSIFLRYGFEVDNAFLAINRN